MNAELAKRFGQVLKKHRVACGLSQQTLAFDTDLDRTYISLLERGLRQPSLSTVFSLAKATGVEPSQLVRETQTIL